MRAAACDPLADAASSRRAAAAPALSHLRSPPGRKTDVKGLRGGSASSLSTVCLHPSSLPPPEIPRLRGTHPARAQRRGRRLPGLRLYCW